MNCCAAESEAVSAPIPIPIPASRATSPAPTRTSAPSPRPWYPSASASPFLPPAQAHHFPGAAIDATYPRDPWEAATDSGSNEWADDMDLESEAGSELSDFEEFEEGLDVLMMLERAYESAIKAHVAPASSSSSAAEAKEAAENGKTQPLMQGSSTALLAVLEHNPQPQPARPRSPAPPRTRTSSLAQPAPRARSPLVPDLAHTSPGPTTRALLHSPSPLPCIAEGSAGGAPRGGAVLKIAHLGDCMGMLVRGEEIVWRSEEMWWSVSPVLPLSRNV